MKIGIFSDSHYSSQEITCGVRFNSRSLAKIKKAYAHFINEDCDIIISLGDLIDTEKTVEEEKKRLSEISEVIGECPIPTVCVMGNHDAFVLTPEQYYGILGIPAPTVLKKDGKRLIFLDACHFKSGVHYQPGDTDWRDSYLPHEEEIKAMLESEECDTYVFLHQNIDPEIGGGHRIYNGDRIFDIINGSGCVKAVFQGHFHPGRNAEYEGVKYVTLPAMCERDDAYFVYEI